MFRDHRLPGQSDVHHVTITRTSGWSQKAPPPRSTAPCPMWHFGFFKLQKVAREQLAVQLA